MDFQLGAILGEGKTPMQLKSSLAQHYNLQSLYFKDETTNPSGSFKDRASAYQFTQWIKQGKNKFVISSSGNAAISCALYANYFHVTLDIFVSSTIDANKLARLESIINSSESENIKIHFSLSARKDAIMFARATDCINLSYTKDSQSIEGYTSLGKEIDAFLQQNGIEKAHLFIPISSGAGFLGLAQGTGYKYPIVGLQTQKIHPVANKFDTSIQEAKSSLATCVSTYYTPYMRKILDVIAKQGGTCYAISDEELKDALNDVKEYENMDISYDSALTIAGLKRFQKDVPIRTAICILTGK